MTLHAAVIRQRLWRGLLLASLLLALTLAGSGAVHPF